jgi:SAM-dependent methyltransferase
VKLSAQQEFYRRLGSSIKQFEILPGFYHAIFQEKDRHLAIQRVRAFILDCFARPLQHNGLLEADKGGFTRTEYDLLRGPGGVRWPLIRYAMKTCGRLSDGIRLGCTAGFDSGVMLDYVYENKPRGITPFGRCIDYFFLNSLGWRGIRVRRENLQCALRRSIEQIYRSGQPVRVLDIASGPGRYLLETMRSMAHIPIRAVLLDYQQTNLEAAQRLTNQLGLSGVSIAWGDAFDPDSLGSITPHPTIAIASGLYELFPENRRVLRSLQGVADVMEDGGHLIYTCQPWHPQLEFIARVLLNREGQPWVMRRRTQAEMDELARFAGFEKIGQETDPWGIFTVSVARRVSR